MSSFGLALSAFRRHKGRMIFTVLSVAMAFAIFTILTAIEQGMDGSMTLASAQRIDTGTPINAPLPVAYAAIIRSVPGVVAVSGRSFFQGYFRDPKKTVPVMAVAVPAFLEVYPEFLIRADQKQAFLHDRQGAIVNEKLAQEMGWHIGQTIPIEGGPTQLNGGTTWFFHIDGVFRTDLPQETEIVLTNYDYFNEGLAPSPQKNTVQVFTELIDNPRNANRIARAIDARFTNASPDTRTENTQEEVQSALRQFGDVGAIITYVGLAVFASMLLITGNTMANSVRERMSEFAIMRALGFSRLQLAFMVFRESAVLTGAGAALGLLVGWGSSKLIAPIMMNVLPSFMVTWITVVLAAAFATVFALATGLLPGRRVASLPVAATLRRA